MSEFFDPRGPIRDRLTLAEIVGPAADCPLCGAELVMDDRRGLWRCSKCPKGGDLFDYVQARDGVDFTEALEYLARRAGVEWDGRD